MIDIENSVLNAVANALRSAYQDITIYGESVEAPSSFPSVSIWEGENTELASNKTLTRETETTCRLMYRVEIYSNLKTGKKAQAKAIANIIDEQMHGFGFERTFCEPLANIDRTIYRIVAQYIKVFQKY